MPTATEPTPAAASRHDTLENFVKFCGQLLEEGTKCTPAEALAKWEAFRPQLDELEEAIASIDLGETIPIETPIAEMEAKIAAVEAETAT